jgi:NADPH-dependent ferric siderophore reductase
MQQANSTTEAGLPAAPTIRRLRHETRRRVLDVRAVERVTPQMIRVTFAGEDLDGFVSASPDDHVKVFLPGSGAEPEMRDYTPRRHDAETGELVIDFVDHDGGPATDWARQAKPGDRLTIGGPRGSQVIEGEIAAWLLIGDETALPAIGRRIEALGEGVPVTSLVAVEGADEEQVFETAADLHARWIHRPAVAAADPAPYLEALEDLALAPGTLVWIAAEAGVARALRTHVVGTLGHPKTWVKAAGYWVKGEADASVKSLEGET